MGRDELTRPPAGDPGWASRQPIADDAGVHQPSPFPPVVRRKGLPWWAWVLLAGVLPLVLIAAGLVVLVVLTARDDPPDVPTATARDGQFEFTAARPDCSRTTVAGKQARGRWCTIALTVRNTGTLPRTYGASIQRGVDASGGRYAPDLTVSDRLSPDAVRDVNPGVQFRAVLAFDVAADITLVALYVHDSPLSLGARLDLP